MKTIILALMLAASACEADTRFGATFASAYSGTNFVLNVTNSGGGFKMWCTSGNPYLWYDVYDIVGGVTASNNSGYISYYAGVTVPSIVVSSGQYPWLASASTLTVTGPNGVVANYTTVAGTNLVQVGFDTNGVINSVQGAVPYTAAVTASMVYQTDCLLFWGM